MIDWYKELGSDQNTTGIVVTRQYIREMDETVKHRGGRFILALWPLLDSLGRWLSLSRKRTTAPRLSRRPGA